MPQSTASEYTNFLNASLTPHHFIETAINFAKKHSFSEHKDTRTKMPAGKYYIVNGTSIFLLDVPSTIKKCSVVTVHIDSPVYKLNVNFLSNEVPKNTGLIPLSITSYGGMLRHTWYDRELFIAGKVIKKDMSHEIISNNRLICVIPSLPPHLNNGNYTKEAFNYSEKIAFSSKINFENLKALADNLSHDLSLVPNQEAFYDETSDFVYSGRQDNLSSCFPALKSILEADSGDSILKIAAFYDYEEIGSLDRSGAFSMSLSQIIEQFQIDPNQSIIICADAAHAFNPLYTNNYEQKHQCHLGDGVVVKYSPRYSTEINSAAKINDMLLKNKIIYQNYTIPNCVAGGSTDGSKLSAKLNIPTVDVGVPLLAMHSCREITSMKDINGLKSLFDAVFRN
ncbi:Aspartyl aminopeptidase 1 [Cucumispora dikerogammari]|nr:Aspartyl aminopeptidase 1 [Cucumispora dikerogammari]